MPETESKTSKARGTSTRGDGDPRRAVQEAHQAYLVALQNANLQAQRPYLDAYTAYLKAAGGADPNEPLNAVSAYHDYVRTVLEAQQSSDVCKLYEDAYREYVGALKAVWGGLDADSVDPATLASLAEAMRVGATIAQSSVRA
jgi:hypothetical protein